MNDEFAKFIWGKRADGLPVPEFDLKKEITPAELQNLYQRYAFVQILNGESAGEFSDIRFIRARSGWLILDYQNAMSASPGEKLFNHGEFIVDPDRPTGELCQRVCSGTGTIVLQIINTAVDMVLIAKEHNWNSVYIVDGHALMKWGVWMTAQNLDIPVIGYEPSREDKERYRRIKDTCPNLIQPIPPADVKPR